MQTCAYDKALQRLAFSIAYNLGIKLHYGVYMAGTGPTYETPAEIRFFSSVGADLVGMSTVPEVIVARHCGIRVFGISVATNVSNFANLEKNLNDGNDVLIQADNAAKDMTELFKGMIGSL